MSPPALSFHLNVPHNRAAKFGPRIGRLTLERHDDSPPVTIDTPGLITATSRGVVPHLSRDHHCAARAVCWVNVPFESFVERDPPIPTLQAGENPLHKFLRFRPGQHLVSMTARDPFDGRVMPPNGKDHMSVYCLRGVRKLTPDVWRSYALKCLPDIVSPLSDIPFTEPPHSQRRITKSIERSAAWLAHFLRPLDDQTPCPMNVILPLVGGSAEAARHAFSESLIEELHGKEADEIKPFKCLDEGVAGYSFDLVPIRQSLDADAGANSRSQPTAEDEMDAGNTLIPKDTASNTSALVPLLKASLAPLPSTKPRIVYSPISPHECLRLIQDVGVDMFDAHWAQRAADIGVALDFSFPVREDNADGRRDVGHNLFDTKYAHDFGRLADAFQTGVPSGADEQPERPVCPCLACSPVPPRSHLLHSSADTWEPTGDAFQPPVTRAYLHHLLWTHEMSAMALLVAHNLAVLDAFFAGVRSVLQAPDGLEHFAREVERFAIVYDQEMGVLEEARKAWADVEIARGKGRMAREKAKQVEASLGTAVEL